MILRFAVAEEPSLRKQTVLWGDRDVSADIATTIPRARREDWLQYEIDYLPQIANLIREGRIEACVTAELRLEVACLKFGGLVTTEYSIFHGLHIRALPPPFPYQRIVASAFHTSEELDSLRESVLRTNFDKRFNELKAAVGGNKNADAFHILSAERAGVDYFLSADRRLINSLRNQRAVIPTVKIAYPSEFLHAFSGYPANPGLT